MNMKALIGAAGSFKFESWRGCGGGVGFILRSTPAKIMELGRGHLKYFRKKGELTKRGISLAFGHKRR